VQVECAEFYVVDDELYRQRGADRGLLSDGAYEGRPAGFGQYVGDVHRLFGPDRLETRPVTEVVLQVVDLSRNRAGLGG
jgi:hypothetical protein